MCLTIAVKRSITLLVVALAVLAGCQTSENSARVQELEEQISDLVDEMQKLNQTTSPPSVSSSLAPTTTSTSPKSTDPASSPTEILTSSYSWNEQSDRVRALQEIIGATPDGSYGPKTREKHLQYLQDQGLGLEGVPAIPSTDPAPTPDGGLTFSRCSDCGQGFPQGSCANWVISVTNSSNVNVSSMTFAPPAASWSNRSGQSVPANAASRKININLDPWATGRFAFQICTTTPSPGPGYEYAVVAPRSVGIVWSNGARGSSCYNLGCY